MNELNWPGQCLQNPIEALQAAAGFHGHAADMQFPNAAAFAEYSNIDVAPSILIGFKWLNWPGQCPQNPVEPRQAPAGSHSHAADLQFPNVATFAEQSNMDVAP